MREFKQKIIDILSDKLNNYFDLKEIKNNLKVPKNNKFGYFSFPCHSLTKKLNIDKKKLDLVVKDINNSLTLPKYFSTNIKDGFINFSIDEEILINNTINDILIQKNKYGSSNENNNKLVVVDYSAPNLGKPLHVGHIRSTILGDSIIKLLNYTGYQTHGINYLGDVGLHIGKTIVAMNLWGDKKRIKENPEKEILDLYVKFNKENIDQSLANEIVKKIEQGDKKTLEDLDFIKNCSLNSFNNVYDLLDVHFDEITGQSFFSDRGKEIAQKFLKSNIAKKDQTGALSVNLDDYNLPEKIILRSDGTAIYSTQDLGAAVYRKEKFNFDKLLYVVASEQEDYFKQIFSILDKAGYDWAKDCIHINFGMINLPDGKMSSREGNIIHLEELLERAIQKSNEIINLKNPNLEDKNKIAKDIGIGAIKYQVLG